MKINIDDRTDPVLQERIDAYKAAVRAKRAGSPNADELYQKLDAHSQKKLDEHFAKYHQETVIKTTDTSNEDELIEANTDGEFTAEDIEDALDSRTPAMQALLRARPDESKE